MMVEPSGSLGNSAAAHSDCQQGLPSRLIFLNVNLQDGFMFAKTAR